MDSTLQEPVFQAENGAISVSTEDIFPIIKKSLYSEQEIFLRELVSNAVDATQKLRYLATRGEFDGDTDNLSVTVRIDKEARTLTVSDQGIGMSAAEVKKYINQVAFSGAEEFVKKFKDAGKPEDIIGRFGLGFYSAFMVAAEVEILTRSFRPEDSAVRWTCDGTTSYSLAPAAREGRGTDVVLHLAEDALEYLEPARIRQMLNRYCKFLPVPVMFEDEQVNNTDPLWRKSPNGLSDEQYLEFFRELYPMADEPLFWIHLNVDYPFTLTGVLFFPKIRQDIDPRRNQIQLYSRQVFITDEVAQIVPEYLMLLQGVIDSPDIPLNVSRSYLQGDPAVKKISEYITKKVADKLAELYKEDAEKFQEKWKDISVFVKYGMLSDEKFYERAKTFCLLHNEAGEYFTPEAYRERVAPLQTDKNGEVICLYSSDPNKQQLYIEAARSRHYDVLILNGVLDTHFISLLERKLEKTRFARVDADTLDRLIAKDGESAAGTEALPEDQRERLKGFFEAARPHEHIAINPEALGAESLPVLITRNEFMRRMKEQAEMGGGAMYFGDFPETLQLSVNTDHPLIRALAAREAAGELPGQLIDLALLSQGMLEGKALAAFIRRSVEMMGQGS